MELTMKTEPRQKKLVFDDFSAVAACLQLQQKIDSAFAASSEKSIILL